MSAAETGGLASRARGGAARSAVMAAAGAVLSGCRPGPDITVAGSYFPSWMGSLVLGVLGTILFWQLFTRTGLDPYLGPRMLVYPGLVILITLVLWLSIFRG
jgi:YtcA family